MRGEQAIQIGERNDHAGRPEDNRDALGHASLMVGNLLVLASGVGGNSGGRMEGNLAVSTALTRFRTLGDVAPAERLTAALSRANDLLAERGAKDPSLRGSGASCGAALVSGGQLHACRAGDVRIFVVRGEQAVDVFPGEPKASDQALQEDAVVGAAARIGALGSGYAARILVTANPIALEPGDRVVLAGPGLHHYVGSREIASIVNSHVPQVASGRLIDTARNAGAKTGISVQVIQYGEPLSQEEEERAVHRAAPTETRSMDLHSADSTEPFQAPVADFPISAEPTQDVVEMPTTAPKNAEVSGALPVQLGVRRRLGGRAANSFETPTFGKWRTPAALAAGLLATVWVWGLVGSGEETTLQEESGTAVAEVGSQPEGSIRPEARILPRGEQGTLLENSALDVPLNDPLSERTKLFWSQVGSAVDSGVVIDAVLVESWLLEGEQDDSAASERAKAYLAEVGSLKRALSAVARSGDSELSAKEARTLDRIFDEKAETGAERLNEYLKNRYDLVGEEVFQSLESYIRVQRTPEVIRTLYALGQVRPRPGPRTREWLVSRLPLILTDH